jgi:hypothetical protein
MADGLKLARGVHNRRLFLADSPVGPRFFGGSGRYCPEQQPGVPDISSCFVGIGNRPGPRCSLRFDSSARQDRRCHGADHGQCSFPAPSFRLLRRKANKQVFMSVTSSSSAELIACSVSV